MKRLLLPLLAAFASFALIGCSTKEIIYSCTRTVGFDTRETFDGVKFIVSLDKSDEGRGLIENVLTGEKEYVIFNDTYRNGKRNKYQPFPESINDIEWARLVDGRVLYFNDGCEED